MRMIYVACAIIIHENKILVAQRSSQMPHPLEWEFPGGKIEADESPELAIVREIKEELDCEVEVCKALTKVEHTYSSRRIVLYPLICTLKNGFPKAIEHQQIAWSNLNDLKTFNWLSADLEVVEVFMKKFKENTSLVINMDVNLVDILGI